MRGGGGGGADLALQLSTRAGCRRSTRLRRRARQSATLPFSLASSAAASCPPPTTVSAHAVLSSAGLHHHHLQIPSPCRRRSYFVSVQIQTIRLEHCVALMRAPWSTL